MYYNRLFCPEINTCKSGRLENRNYFRSINSTVIVLLLSCYLEIINKMVFLSYKENCFKLDSSRVLTFAYKVYVLYSFQHISTNTNFRKIVICQLLQTLASVEILHGKTYDSGIARHFVFFCKPIIMVKISMSVCQWVCLFVCLFRIRANCMFIYAY